MQSETEKMHNAEKIRTACLRVAKEAYEQAGLSGLCADGRWECALSAVRALDLSSVLEPDSANRVPE